MVNKKKDNWKVWAVFWSFLILMLVFNFVHEFFNVSYFQWHLFLHGGIIFFSFLILLYSLKLNEKAKKYIIVGSVLWIIINAVLFLGHIFEEYSWLGTSLFTFLGMVVGCLILMKGFKEGVGNSFIRLPRSQTKEAVNG